MAEAAVVGARHRLYFGCRFLRGLYRAGFADGSVHREGFWHRKLQFCSELDCISGIDQQFGVLTAPASPGNITVTATAAGDATKSAFVTVKSIATVNSGFTYEGITHVSWGSGEYSSTAGAAAQDAIPQAGGNWAGALVTWYMPAYTSTTIAPVSYTPSDADVVAAITELHNKGMKVMLKPHVDVLDGTWLVARSLRATSMRGLPASTLSFCISRSWRRITAWKCCASARSTRP